MLSAFCHLMQTHTTRILLIRSFEHKIVQEYTLSQILTLILEVLYIQNKIELKQKSKAIRSTFGKSHLMFKPN